MKVKLDLHTHSTCSDGSFSSRELLCRARQLELELFSITDHDNIDHINILDLEEDIEDPIYIRGVEISAEFPTTLHILGYDFDPGNRLLNQRLDQLQEYRRSRNEQMLKNMSELGFQIAMEELLAEAGGETIGRPHFASLMLQKGYVSSYQEAFDRYLAKGKPFYLDKKRMDPDAAIRLILQAGGIPVLAHPYQTGLAPDDLDKLIADLKEYGLVGIEAFYSLHTPAQVSQYLTLAEKYDLLITAGSDYHGSSKLEISLGMEIEREHMSKLMERLGI